MYFIHISKSSRTRAATLLQGGEELVHYQTPWIQCDMEPQVLDPSPPWTGSLDWASLSYVAQWDVVASKCCAAAICCMASMHCTASTWWPQSAVQPQSAAWPQCTAQPRRDAWPVLDVICGLNMMRGLDVMYSWDVMMHSPSSTWGGGVSSSALHPCSIHIVSVLLFFSSWTQSDT